MVGAGETEGIPLRVTRQTDGQRIVLRGVYLMFQPTDTDGSIVDTRQELQRILSGYHLIVNVFLQTVANDNLVADLQAISHRTGLQINGIGIDNSRIGEYYLT